MKNLLQHYINILLEKKIKSNDRMPSKSKSNIENMIKEIDEWKSNYKKETLNFIEKTTPENFFEIIHSIRRWYSGGTMAHKIKSYRKSLREVMDLEPKDPLKTYRGFKVDKDDKLTKYEVGDEFDLDVIKNDKFSSWSISKDATNKFSGKSATKIGLIVQLISTKNVVPILAPPERTENWFNAVYEKLIGKSFRIKEGEYLIYGSPLKVKLIEKKK